MVWRLSWPGIFCKDVVANVCRSTCGLTSLVISARLATALTMSRARCVLQRERFLQSELVLQDHPHAVRHRHHADLGILAALGPDGCDLPRDMVLPMESSRAGVPPRGWHQTLRSRGALFLTGRRGGCLAPQKDEGETTRCWGVSFVSRSFVSKKIASSAEFVGAANGWPIWHQNIRTLD